MGVFSILPNFLTNERIAQVLKKAKIVVIISQPFVNFNHCLLEIVQIYSLPLVVTRYCMLYIGIYSKIGYEF